LLQFIERYYLFAGVVTGVRNNPSSETRKKSCSDSRFSSSVCIKNWFGGPMINPIELETDLGRL